MPIVVVEEPTFAAPLLELPTRLVLESRSAGLDLAAAPVALKVRDTAATVALKSSDAGLAIDGPSADLELSDTGSRLALDDNPREVILDG